jgi:hypothetical protein
MGIDPIVDELHRLRAEQMARFHGDMDAFFRWLKEQEKKSASTRRLLEPPRPGSPRPQGGHGSRDVRR